ncbi:DUF4197 domain-containing protein [Thermodesulfobacteriota bacterium]
MKILFQQLSKHCFISLFIIAIITSFLALGPSKAESSWWQKGVDLFKGSGETATQAKLTNEEIGLGLKDALLVGSENVISQLGREGGFNTDPAIHIPLPKSLATAQTWLGKVGMASLLDDLELKLNRAAEVATPKAKDLFVQAIREMTFEDVMNIYNGPNDAATRYFQSKMSVPLAQEMSPIVSDSLSEVGAIQSYDNAMKEYKSIPFAPDAKADLTTYVVEKGIDGIFHYIAIEEAAIRQDPVKRTTYLLQKVFGAK